MQIHTFRCFGEYAGGGNPALVIEDDRSSTEARQAFARQQNVTCVWIDPSDKPDLAAVVDYFYPHMRSPLCLHATLAVGQQLFSRHGRKQELAVMTAVRRQRLGLAAGDKGDVLVRLQVQDAPQPDLSHGLIQHLLAAPALAPLTRARVVSVGSPVGAALKFLFDHVHIAHIMLHRHRRKSAQQIGHATKALFTEFESGIPHADQ